MIPIRYTKQSYEPANLDVDEHTVGKHTHEQELLSLK